jgi:hypothetical protein
MVLLMVSNCGVALNFILNRKKEQSHRHPLLRVLVVSEYPYSKPELQVSVG